MPLATSRAVLRPSRTVFRHITRYGRRHEATTAEAAKAKASEITSKASEGLSKVKSSAGAVASKAGSATSEAAEKVASRGGRLVSAVQAIIPPTIYYSRVGLELSKLVFQGQKMTPPSLSQFQQYFAPVLHAIRHPATLVSQSQALLSQPRTLLDAARGLTQANLVAGAIVFAELLGFFTVGEIIGKMKLVGYRGDTGHH